LKWVFQFAVAVAIALAATSISVEGADLAVLRNGNTIRHERREVVGAVTRLYLSDSASGYIEIPTDQIEHFEKDTAPPPLQLQAIKPVTGATIQRQQFAATPRSVNTMTRQDLNTVVSGAGERNQIDPDFINSVIRAESGFHQNAVSKKGAQGLMQLMPGTASQLGVHNAFDPHANVEGGTKYLRELLEKYNYDVPKALAAYNAGSKRVDQYHGIPPYYETQTYIARIIRDFNRKKLAENPALAKKAGSQHPTAGNRGLTKPNSVGRSSKPLSVGPQGMNAAAANSPQGAQTASR